MDHALSMNNPYPFAISGRVIFHPQGASGTASDRSLSYVLAPHQTKEFADLVAAASGNGMGSLDVVAAVGGPPVMTVRIVDEASPAKPAAMMSVQDPRTHLYPDSPAHCSNYSVQLTVYELMQTNVVGRNSLTFAVEQGSAFVYGAAIQNDGSGVLVQSASPIVAE